MVASNLTVEQVLHLIEDRAALLHHFAECAAVNRDAASDSRALSGFAEAAGEIVTWSHAISEALDVTTLAREVVSDSNRSSDR
jgi:hypothetical protein